MKISERKAQIWRIQSTSFQPEWSSAVEAKLRQAVVGVTKATLEAALKNYWQCVRIKANLLNHTDPCLAQIWVVKTT